MNAIKRANEKKNVEEAGRQTGKQVSESIHTLRKGQLGESMYRASYPYNIYCYTID